MQIIASSSRGNALALHPEGGSPLLVEAGLPFPRLRAALNHRVTALAGCVVSHEHADHAQGAMGVAKSGVNVYATPGTLAALRLTGHRAKPLAMLEPARVGQWSVMAFPAVHDAAEPAGFLLAHGSDRLLYLTDSAFCAYRFDGLTTVLVEANYSSELLRENVASGRLEHVVAQRIVRNHLSLERCIDLLKANDLSRVREIHLLHLSSGNADSMAFKAAVERATGRPTYVAAERTAA